jgi:integrase
MRAAREEGLHDNGAIESRKFRVLTADVENIYLTESEIRAIAALDLSKNRHRDVARDIFLVGCYTAQRFSDYSTINEGNIRTLENGQQVIDLKQQKTGNHVVIPVRPELQAILEKYDNRLPRTYEQKVNHLIKEIAREAGITEKVEVSYIENGEKKSRLVEKCDLVKTHAAQRRNEYVPGGNPDHRHHEGYGPQDRTGVYEVYQDHRGADRPGADEPPLFFGGKQHNTIILKSVVREFS